METYEDMNEVRPPDVPPAVKPIMDMAWSENAHPLLANDPKYGRPGLVTRKIIRVLMQRVYKEGKLSGDELYTLVYGKADESLEKAQKIGPRVREAKELLDRYFNDNPNLEYRAVIFSGNEDDGTGERRGFSLRIRNNALDENFWAGIHSDASFEGNCFRWKGRELLNIKVIWRPLRANTPHGLPIEDVNLLCDADNDYRIPPVLDPYQDELLRRFNTRSSGWHNGRIYRVIDYVPTRDADCAYAHKLNLIGQFAYYRDYIITNRSAAEVVGSRKEKVWQLLSSTPYEAWDHTANPLCINLLLILKPSNKVVINFRSTKNQVNGEQYGPSISETVNANNLVDYMLVEADQDEQLFVKNVLQHECRVLKISTRELLVKAANQELGYPVGHKLSNADIRVVAYARGNREGHVALLAVAYIEMSEYEVMASRSDRSETESVLCIPFDEKSVFEFLGNGEQQPGKPNPKYRRTPYLELCLAHALYDAHGPEALFEL